MAVEFAACFAAAIACLSAVQCAYNWKEKCRVKKEGEKRKLSLCNGCKHLKQKFEYRTFDEYICDKCGKSIHAPVICCEYESKDGEANET